MALTQAISTASGIQPSAVYYHNCQLTFGLPQRPFDPLLYGAMQSLIHYRQLNLTQRRAVVSAMQTASRLPQIDQFGKASLYRPYLAIAMRELDQQRANAYGLALDDWSISHNTQLVFYPWGLTDSEFRAAYRCVFSGNEPDDSKFDAWHTTKTTATVLEKVEDKATSFIESEAWKAAETFVMTFAPRTLGLAFKIKNLSGPVGFVIGLALDITKKLAEDRMRGDFLAELNRRFEIERVRRGGCNV